MEQFNIYLLVVVIETKPNTTNTGHVLVTTIQHTSRFCVRLVNGGLVLLPDETLQYGY